MKFQDKIVLVTGSTRGIGLGIAESFASAGATVILTGRNQAKVDEICHILVDKGMKAQGYACDVTDMSSVQETVGKVLDNHKRVDILINNAGITKDNLLLRMSEEDWDDVIQTNLKGVFSFTKTVAKAMLKAKQGKIINISSIIGMTGNTGQANYAASKAGVIAFTKSIAQELASRSINVNAVAPGYIQTDMTSQMDDNAKQAIIGNIPLGDLGCASDVANVCLFLASDEARYITGQTVVVDGGLTL